MFKILIKPLHFHGLVKPLMRTVIGARPSTVPTHRNELLPFTINNLWDNPGMFFPFFDFFHFFHFFYFHKK